MELNVKNKIQKRMIMLVVLVLAALVCITTIALVGLRGKTYDIVSLSEKKDYLHTAQLSVEKTRTLLRDLKMYQRDIENIEQIKIQISDNINLINTSLHSYIQSEYNFMDMHEQDSMQKVLALTEDYSHHILQMTELALSGNTEAVDKLSLEILPLISEIDANLRQVSDFITATTMMVADRSELYRNNTIVILIIASVASAVIILLVFSVIIKTLNSPADLTEQPQYAQDNYNGASMKNQYFSLPELEQCISDLKAVTYDLSKSAKELKDRK